ncbi:MAG TPA: hypothetical protein IGR64_06095 [Leptolyngbyaceae cyanobacterium M65_K2018_010]|nr:hypothetical protein [Leptolyngbyaceae cyanobacterium M65_K2018_010]
MNFICTFCEICVASRSRRLEAQGQRGRVSLDDVRTHYSGTGMLTITGIQVDRCPQRAG